MKKLILTILGIVMFCTNANASLVRQTARYGRVKTATASVRATIIQPSGAQVQQNLDLGIIQIQDKDIISINKSNNSTGSTFSKSLSGIFNIIGPKGQAVNVNIPEAKFHGDVNKVAEFKPTISYNGKAIALSPSDGKAEFRVGGTLKLNDIPPKGTHNGVYVVQMSY